MPAESVAANVFFSYAHEDEKLRDELAVHLKLMERQHLIQSWHDRRIGAGKDWKEQIDAHLEQADVILLLISADFLASDYSYEIEMKRALERHRLGEAVIIPVILRAVDWTDSPVGQLQALPPDGRPVTSYSDKDEAYRAITSGIKRAIEDLKANRRGHSLPAPPPPVAKVYPVDESHPFVQAIAVDVSGSMQDSIGGLRGSETRLEGVMRGIKNLTTAQTGAEGMARMVRIFAYGFGFNDRAADYGSLIGLARGFLASSIPELPQRVYRGSVRDLFEIAGLGRRSLLLNELGDRWPELETGLWAQRIDLFGGTPMCSAMQIIRDRFAGEFAAHGSTRHSALLIISDGESTDGSPVELCQEMKAQGTIVMAGYLTSADVAEPYVLYAAAPENWPAGAKALFECSSALGEGDAALSILQNQGWRATRDSRLFVQLNQSEMLSRFISLVLALSRDRAKATGEGA